MLMYGISVDESRSVNEMGGSVAVRLSCQLDAFQMDAVNFQRANKTCSNWTRPNETRSK